MMRRALALLFVTCLAAVGGHAWAADRYTRVYMFGVSLSFTDSLCIITPIQYIDSAFISKEGFLKERTLYAYQLEDHLEHEGHPSTTCVILWDEKLQNIERLHAQIQKKYSTDSSFKLQNMDAAQFAFRREEHITE